MAARTVDVQIGINGAFLTRRWEEPRNWMALTRECGYTVHSFCSDVLDPFFSGDRSFQLEQAAAVKEAAAEFGVTLCDMYTGVATHRFHGLSHADERVRRRMGVWIEQAAELAAAMGAHALGGHWDAFSVEVLSNPQRIAEATARLYETFRNLAVAVEHSGVKALYQEQMYIPSEKPWTMDECEEFLVEVNRNNSGVPVYVTLDVGHVAGCHYGLSGPDTDYLEWLKRFAGAAEVIHLQQTTADASHHWPFTSDFNARGCVDIGKTLDALQFGHKHHHTQPFAPYLPGVTKNWLVAEVIPGSTKDEATLLKELTESADYLRAFVPVEGLKWTFGR